MNTQPYLLNAEFNATELLAHMDIDYILNTLEDKLSNMNFASSIVQPNIIVSLEENFKNMKLTFEGDSANINVIRGQVYMKIIDILCKHYNLRFNVDDPNIDLYTAAFYAYDFLVSNVNTYMINFFTSYIINNKESLYNALNLDTSKKSKDSGSVYNRNVYTDPKIVAVAANIEKAIKLISTLDVKLVNIFQSIYVNPETVMFLDNAFADIGNFFVTYYCSIVNRVDCLPVLITNIRLNLQRIVGDTSSVSIQNLINNQ